MLKSNLFEQAFAKIKVYLPDIEARKIVQKILRECDILTYSEIESYVRQVDTLRSKLQSLEHRVDELSKNNT